MGDSRFILECTPPRAPRNALVRPRLTRTWADLRDVAAIVVDAPRGFGKTTLLTQWRKLWLESGALVAWLTLDVHDDPARFAEALFCSMRMASGRPSFDALALQFALSRGEELGALTVLLTEIAKLAAPTAIMLDEAEQLPEATARACLSYLLHNAPPNLHVVVGTRTSLPFATADLAAHGRLAMLRTRDLQFSQEESIEILRKRLGHRANLDDLTRLHEITEGWPIGLQLAASSVEHATDIPAAILALSAREGDLERYFLESLLEGLPTELAWFLERISILEFMIPEACEAVTGHPAAADKLRQLARDTPILIVGERRDSSRLHPLARDFLLGRFDRLPEPERRELHRRAMRWFETKSQYPEAARHALAAGDDALAYHHAQRSLWDLVKQGRLSEAREWLARLQEREMGSDPVFRISAAWVMALGARPAEGRRIAEEIAQIPDVTPDLRFEAAVVEAVAATFSDRPDDLRRALAGAPSPSPPPRDPIVGIAHANHAGLLAYFEGDTTRVRQLLRAALASRSGTPQHAISYSHCLDGAAHLWDGDAIKADAAVRPALDLVERETGRRSVMAAALATVLAAAVYERDQPEIAQGLLANRLDVIERTGVPEIILYAYRTLAYVALAQGDERRALDTLGGLGAIGVAQRWPRAMLSSLVEQVRIHALRSRGETTREKFAALDALAPMFAQDGYSLFEPYYRLQSAIAQVYAALAESDVDAADRHLACAGPLAARLHRGRDALVVKVLRGIVAHERGEAGPLLAEAAELAALGGLDRLLVDVHPLAPRLVEHVHQRRRRHVTDAVHPGIAASGGAAAPKAGALRGAVTSVGAMLTPKEAEILRLLDASLPNKQIAKTMDISDETVKWHLKNLFSKLNAGSRRHAVDRARLMGLLAS